MSAALRLSAEVEDAVIVCIVCDRGDRYLSTGIPYIRTSFLVWATLCTLVDLAGSCKYQQLAAMKISAGSMSRIAHRGSSMPCWCCQRPPLYTCLCVARALQRRLGSGPAVAA